MGAFDLMGGEYEQVVYNHDPASGLKAIIAIHSTALGPALGGTRFYPYPSEDDALRDVLRLARGMSYKAAAAGLNLGGGKAVIIGDPKRTSSAIPSGSSPRRCCGPTAASSRAWAAATSPPRTSAPTPPTWTWSRWRPASSPAAR
jgi:hypothetical protein